MPNKVAIVTDTTAALPDELNEQYDLHLVPLCLLWDGVTYTDKVDISPDEFYKKLSTSKTLPTTSQPSVAAFSDVYAPLIAEGYDILTLPISSKISGTFDSASIAAKQYPEGRIAVLDTLSASLALGMITILAARAAQRGATLLECRNIAVDAASRMHILFAVETLEYLHKGGRINTAAKFLGNTLDLKPILELQDGFISPIERVRTSKKAHSRLLELTEMVIGPNGAVDFLGVVSAAASEQAADLLRKAQDHFRINEMLSTELSPILGAHVGPGTVGIVFLA